MLLCLPERSGRCDAFYISRGRCVVRVVQVVASMCRGIVFANGGQYSRCALSFQGYCTTAGICEKTPLGTTGFPGVPRGSKCVMPSRVPGLAPYEGLFNSQFFGDFFGQGVFVDHGRDGFVRDERS